MPPVYSTVPEQSFLLRRALRGRQPEVAVRRGRSHPPPRGPLEKSLLDEERLVHVLDRVPLLAHRRRDRFHADGAAVELLEDDPEDLPVHHVETLPVHLHLEERVVGDLLVDRAVPAHLGEVAEAVEETDRHARGAPGAPGDFARTVVVDEDRKGSGGPADHLLEFRGGVIFHPERDSEPVPQRGGKKTGPGRGAYECERRQGKPDRLGRRPLPENDVDGEILHGGVQQFLHDAAQAVDLVDEKNVPRLERGEDRGDVAFSLHRGAGSGADPHPHLVGDDVRQGRLSQAGRAGKEDVVERLAPVLRRLDERLEVGDDRSLADEPGEEFRPQGEIERPLLPASLRVHHTSFHVASLAIKLPDHLRGPERRFSAPRIRTSAGASAPASLRKDATTTCASARENPRATSAWAASTSGSVDAGIPSSAGTGVSSTDTLLSRSGSSSAIRCASFFPMPWTRVKGAASPRALAERTPEIPIPDKIDTADFGPTPLTPMIERKISRSVSEEKPKSSDPPSRIWRKV